MHRNLDRSEEDRAHKENRPQEGESGPVRKLVDPASSVQRDISYRSKRHVFISYDARGIDYFVLGIFGVSTINAVIVL
jgi:hypothetical protein